MTKHDITVEELEQAVHTLAGAIVHHTRDEAETILRALEDCTPQHDRLGRGGHLLAVARLRTLVELRRAALDRHRLLQSRRFLDGWPVMDDAA